MIIKDIIHSLIVILFLGGCRGNSYPKTVAAKNGYTIICNTTPPPDAPLSEGNYKDSGKIKVYSPEILLALAGCQGIDLSRDSMQIKADSNIIVHHLGPVTLLHTQLYSREIIPANVSNNYIFLIAQNTSKIYCFCLDQFVLLKLQEQDSGVYLGGSFSYRGKGQFFIYDFDGQQFKTIFKTDGTESIMPLYSYKNDNACWGYENERLQVQSTDLNKDSLNDLTFSGNVLLYCRNSNEFKGYEGKPRKIPVKVQYIQSRHANGISWTVKDSTYWHLLNEYY